MTVRKKEILTWMKNATSTGFLRDAKVFDYFAKSEQNKLFCIFFAKNLFLSKKSVIFAQILEKHIPLGTKNIRHYVNSIQIQQLQMFQERNCI